MGMCTYGLRSDIWGIIFLTEGMFEESQVVSEADTGAIELKSIAFSTHLTLEGAWSCLSHGHGMTVGDTSLERRDSCT